jgi:hypothetical protein
MNTEEQDNSTIPVEIISPPSKVFEFISPLSPAECLDRLHDLSQETFMFGGALNRTVKIFEVSANEYAFEIEECTRPRYRVAVVAKAVGDLTSEGSGGKTLVRGKLYLGNTYGLTLLAAFFSILSTIYAWNTGGIEPALQSFIIGLLVISGLYWLAQADRNRLMRLLERTLTN